MGIFDEMKSFTGMSTTEQIFGIEPQPPETCPKIDEIIYEVEDKLKTITALAKDLSCADQEEAKALARDILWYSDCSPRNELNELRSQIDLLRSWGQGWKDLAKSLIEKETDFGMLTDTLYGFSPDTV